MGFFRYFQKSVKMSTPMHEIFMGLKLQQHKGLIFTKMIFGKFFLKFLGHNGLKMRFPGIFRSQCMQLKCLHEMIVPLRFEIQ